MKPTQATDIASFVIFAISRFGKNIVVVLLRQLWQPGIQNVKRESRTKQLISRLAMERDNRPEGARRRPTMYPPVLARLFC